MENYRPVEARAGVTQAAGGGPRRPTGISTGKIVTGTAMLFVWLLYQDEVVLEIKFQF